MRISDWSSDVCSSDLALQLFHRRAVHKALSIDDIQLGMVELGAGRSHTPEEVAAPPADLPEIPPVDDQSLNLRTRKSALRTRTPRQRDYLNQLLRHSITLGLGR